MTLKEIARLAGVSPAAVSRYLNGGSLSAEKREAIGRVIEQTDFTPNRLAHDLRTGRVRQVGIIVPKIHSTSVSEVLDGIESILSQHGYMTVLGSMNEDPEQEVRYVSLMQSYRLAGIIIMAQTVSEEREKIYRKMDIPVVITGQKYPGLNCIYHDDYHAMQALMERLLQSGSRRIAYIGVDESDPAVGIERRKAVEDTFRQMAQDPDSVLMSRTAPFSVEGGYEAMQQLLEQADQYFDGLLCATDSIAQGAMIALKEAGYKIPEHIRVAAIGNDESNRISEPQLTTARLFQHECGEEAATMLLKLMQSEERPMPRQMMLGYTIIPRGTLT